MQWAHARELGDEAESRNYFEASREKDNAEKDDNKKSASCG